MGGDPVAPTLDSAVDSRRHKGKIFRSLHNPNFRRYFLGHGLSQTGAWIQRTAELWLVFEITGSGTALGVYSVLRYGPILFFGMHAGLLTDRHDRLKMLFGTQGLLTVTSGVLTLAAMFGQPSLTLIYGLVSVQGIVNAVDNPLRRAFVRDLVSDDELANAISLKLTAGMLAQTIGPAAAGVLIAIWGVAICFLINTLSFLAVMLALFLIDRSKMRQFEPIPRAPRQLGDGLRYAWADRQIRALLFLAAIVAVFAWNWETLVPVYAKDTFGGDAALYGVMLSIIGLGSVAGAMENARHIRVTRKRLAATCFILAGSLLAAALAPATVFALIALFFAGATTTALVVGLQSRLQLGLRDDMSGRVLGLYSVSFTGAKPVGGVVSGAIIDLSGVRVAFGLSAGVVAASAIWLSCFRFNPSDRQPKVDGGGQHSIAASSA